MDIHNNYYYVTKYGKYILGSVETMRKSTWVCIIKNYIVNINS
jgi:hypothetical protein